MRHAILILAHKNLEQLFPLAEYFATDCLVYIHIDKKCVLNEDGVSQLKSLPWVRLLDERFNIHWGGFSMLEAELRLFDIMLKECQTEYIHLISGQDYPIKPLHVFLQFFSSNYGLSFLEYKPYPQKIQDYSIYSHGEYFLPYDMVDGRTTLGIRKVNKWVEHQKHCGFRRQYKNPFTARYKGSQWFSVTRKVIQLLLDFTRNDISFYNSMKYTFAPEEIYIPTVLVNLAGNSIENNNLRYIRWNWENGSNPSNLGIDHLDDIKESDAFFARKMEPPYCTPLIQAINLNLITA